MSILKPEEATFDRLPWRFYGQAEYTWEEIVTIEVRGFSAALFRGRNYERDPWDFEIIFYNIGLEDIRYGADVGPLTIQALLFEAAEVGRLLLR